MELFNILFLLFLFQSCYSCSNFLVDKDASIDGSNMISYAADSHTLYGQLYYKKGDNHKPDDKREVYDWDTHVYLNTIPEASVTYTRMGNMNELQVAIGETTWGGRDELHNPEGKIDYGSMIYIALERSKSAREAITIMTELTEKYGYYSEGETFSIADKNEVWVMDLVGKGKGVLGSLWVARKIPSGYVMGHANHARIGKFPRNDSDTLYAKDVVSFARDKGWYTGSDEDFEFNTVYNPLDFSALRFCEARVWSMFNRINTKLNFTYDDYIKVGPNGEPPVKKLPLWILPEKKVSTADVMRIMRDHFENTELDMTVDVGSGPYQVPYRWRPMEWTLEGETTKYYHERAISTQQTGWSFVAQLRSSLPDIIGGVLWFGVDDTYTTVYSPIYAALTSPPVSYSYGDYDSFSWDSGFWVFNLVANWAYTRYCDMIIDIQPVQQSLEETFFKNQNEVESKASSLYASSKEAAVEFLNNYSNEAVEHVVSTWRKLGEFLIWKYNDGNVKKNKKPTFPGYPNRWYKTIVSETGDRYKETPIKN